jgi:hypothetical protein
MFAFKKVRALLFSLLLVSLALVPSVTQSRAPSANMKTFPIGSAAQSSAANSTFYSVRPDMRKCASPMCGGYFVRRVNQTLTDCANGKQMAECYVASIDWNGTTEVDPGRALIRGTLLTQGKYGVLKVSEAWRAVADSTPTGEFYRAIDLGLRCIAAPCETHHEAKLNTTIARNIAGVNLPGPEISKPEMEEISRAMRSTEGVLLAGSLAEVSGPAGRSKTLNATQLYLRASGATSLKPCIKTGCSGQICADETMMSTCEYRAEYECYKKATCERQDDGNCGFTKTPELTSCLARNKKKR